MNRARENVVDSNFLCSEYDGRDDLATNETDSWERDHRCETVEITTKENTWGSNWNSDIHGIQGRLIA